MIVGVLVTFEPDLGQLTKTVKSLADQVDYLVIVDNGSEQDLAQFESTTVTLEQLPDNVGIAAAQNHGIDIARSRKAQFVVLSDQDTVYPLGTISRLLDVFERWPHAAAVVPLFNDVHKLGSDGFILENSLFFSSSQVKGGEHILLQAIASGKVLRLAALEEIGAMDEDLFIDWVDLEWCWRAGHRGYQVIGTGDVEVTHSLGDSSRDLGYREVNLRSPLRHYYITRNAFSLALRTPYLSGFRRCVLFLRSLRYPIAFPLLSQPHGRNFRAVIAGVNDAVVGKLGKTDRIL